MPPENTRQALVDLPKELAEIRQELLALPGRERLTMLAEFGDELRELPARLREKPELLEQVTECQSPLAVRLEVQPAGTVVLHATAAEGAPTTRGFAAVLQQGVDGLPVAAVLAIPSTLPLLLGLDEVVSPLRLRGMSALLGRVQRQARAHGDATEAM